MNLGLYGFGPKRARRWLMVDLGMSFAGDEAPGVDLVLPTSAFSSGRRSPLRDWCSPMVTRIMWGPFLICGLG